VGKHEGIRGGRREEESWWKGMGKEARERAWKKRVR